MNQIEKLKELISGKNPKSFHRLVSSNESVREFVLGKQKELNTKSLAETIYCLMHDTIPQLCVCGKPALFNTFVKGYRTACSVKCKQAQHSEKISSFWQNNPESLKQMRKKQKETIVKKYGVTNIALAEVIQQKIKKTNLERYGAETPMQSKIIQNKIKQVCLEKYGVEYPLQSAEIRQRAQETFLERHGEPNTMQYARQAFRNSHAGLNPFQVDGVKEKIRATLIKKYGITSPKHQHLSKDVLEVLKNRDKFVSEVCGKTLEIAAIDLGVDPTTIARHCNQYECRDIIAVHKRSKWEHLISKFLEENNIKYIANTKKIIPPVEIDFYLPEHNIALEVGSILWHSDIRTGRGKEYHYNKYARCKQLGIKLFQWFDDELTTRWPVIQSKILYETKKIKTIVGARQINSIQLLTYTQEFEFLENNHIQGSSKDRTATYGAFVDGELVGLLSYKKHSDSLEITRYCTKIFVSYPGLFSKLMNYMVKDLNYSGLIYSFSNNLHSSGALYAASGFAPAKETPPGYYYTLDYHTRFSRHEFMKSKIKKRFDVDIEGKTEWQLMQELGYDRIWDAGKLKWVKEV